LDECQGTTRNEYNFDPKYNIYPVEGELNGDCYDEDDGVCLIVLVTEVDRNLGEYFSRGINLRVTDVLSSNRGCDREL
jgi:hypothetical protein